LWLATNALKDFLPIDQGFSLSVVFFINPFDVTQLKGEGIASLHAVCCLDKRRPVVVVAQAEIYSQQLINYRFE
jgi:hypothetical protein